jgi:pyruvate formate lyase activating enzyme
MTRPPVCQRAVLYVTKLCNIECEFCYYHLEQGKHHEPIEALEARFQAWSGGEYRVKAVDITGGEPTVHPRIRDIVRMSVSYGIRPTVITNGQRPKLIAQLYEDGLDDTLVSVHALGDAYDTMVRRKGAFEKLDRTVQMLHDRGLPFRTNTTLTAGSVSNIESITDYLLAARPHIINLIAFNPHDGTLWANEVNLKFQATYSDMAAAATYVIDRAERAGIWVNVRYMPLCFMKDYESHVCNFRQWQFDPYEWEFFSSNLRKDAPELLRAAKAASTFGQTDDEQLYHHLMVISTKSNERAEACSTCRYAAICDGIYPQYARVFGTDEFSGPAGEPIVDPLHFRVADLRWTVPSRQ